MRTMIGLGMSLALLASGPAQSRGLSIDAPLRDGAGQARGKISLRGPRLSVAVTGLAPGVRAVHVHEKGLCAGPDFKSAGGHWNPAMKQHGRDNPMGAHEGDLPNMTVGANGRGKFAITLPALASPFASAGGLSVVVHAAPDDFKTDPSGNSGARIACAVLIAPVVVNSTEPPR